MGERLSVTLVCSVCDGRNYKTTRKATQMGQIELKKFCPHCGRHTLHKEAK